MVEKPQSRRRSDYLRTTGSDLAVPRARGFKRRGVGSGIVPGRSPGRSPLELPAQRPRHVDEAIASFPASPALLPLSGPDVLRVGAFTFETMPAVQIQRHCFRTARSLARYCTLGELISLNIVVSPGNLVGGESGIRTHGRVSPTHAFQACSIDHSDISPFRINELRAARTSVAQNPP